MSSWRSALLTVAPAAHRSGATWLVTDVTAAALHGVGVTPASVSLLVRTPSDAARLAGHLTPFAAAQASGTRASGDFLSGVQQPLAVDADTVFGGWLVDGVRVELSQSCATASGRLWDAHVVDLDGVGLPVVSLEWLAARALAQGDPDLDAVVGRLTERGADAGLLAESLRSRGFTPTTVAAHPALVALLP